MYNNSLTKGTILRGSSYSYEIVKTLGQGSFGITYLASVKMAGALGTIDANIKVAIKEFFMKEINGREGTTVTSGSKDGLFEDYRRKFVREAKNLSKLRHPNIVNVLEAFETNNTCYYVMEYMDGGSLDELIAKRHGLSEAETARYALQIASALSFMHKNKMLHLDLKPKNIMMNNGNAVLIDFGLSKQYNGNGEPESSTTVGAGTPGYAPIEQANYQDGNGFPVTMDIYALGATMFKMLTGERPPIASDILNDGFPSQLLKDKSQEQAVVVEKAMQPMKKQRIQTVEEMSALICGKQRKEPKKPKFENKLDEETVIESPRNNESSYTNYREKTSYNVSNQKPKVSKTASNTKKYITLGIIGSILLILLGYNYIQPQDTVSQKDLKPVLIGTINGHEYVDLGLSVKWATCNVGADSPSDYGDYFAWGETSTKSEYTEENSTTYEKSISDISGDSQYDVARANWGGTWRLPTAAEIDELTEKCKRKWITEGGHNGYRVTGPNGKSIFLPAAGWRYRSFLNYFGELGHYWSSTPRWSDTLSTYYLRFNSGSFGRDWYYRFRGHAVRPVSN